MKYLQDTLKTQDTLLRIGNWVMDPYNSAVFESIFLGRMTLKGQIDDKKSCYKIADFVLRLQFVFRKSRISVFDSEIVIVIVRPRKKAMSNLKFVHFPIL